jgi:hypothetical protein
VWVRRERDERWSICGPQFAAAPNKWNETTSASFGLLAGSSTPERASIYRALQDPAKVADAQKWLREHAPGEYSKRECIA